MPRFYVCKLSTFQQRPCQTTVLLCSMILSFMYAMYTCRPEHYISGNIRGHSNHWVLDCIYNTLLYTEHLFHMKSCLTHNSWYDSIHPSILSACFGLVSTSPKQFINSTITHTSIAYIQTVWNDDALASTPQQRCTVPSLFIIINHQKYKRSIFQKSIQHN